MRRRFALLLPALGFLLAGPAGAQFADRTETAGLVWHDLSWGAAFADVDGDGFLDIYAGHHFSNPILFWNTGGAFDSGVHPQPWSGSIDRHGAVFITVNGDDRPEIFITHGGAGGAGSEANELYRNDGGGSLISLLGAGGMSDPPGRSRCASAADFNGDHRADVWVGKAPDATSFNSLFRQNASLSFTDVAPSVGLNEPLGTVGGIWGDYDLDGDPDLLVGGEEFTRPTVLFRNDGGTSFANVSSLFAPTLPIVSGADWGDFDVDGDLDLAVCNGQIGIFDTYAAGDTVTFFFNTRYGDTGLDALKIPSTADTAWARFRYLADPDPSVIFLGPSGVHPPPSTTIVLTDDYVGEPPFVPGVDVGIFVWRNEPGGAWSIYCSTPNLNYDVFDGWFTDGTYIRDPAALYLEDPGFVSGGPKVWRNDGGSFVEITAALGLPAAMVNPRDISWVDFDNDGDLDLHVVDMGTTATYNAPDALFRNDGSVFTDVTLAEGVAGGSEALGDGAVWGDADNDGDLDLFVLEGAGPESYSEFGPALYLRNEGNRGSSIQLTLTGRASGAPAIGAKVTAVAGGLRITRWVTANSWRGFQDPLRLHFGIGAAALADSVIVEWPAGPVHRYVNVLPGIYGIEEDIVALGAPITATGGTPWSVSGPRPQPARGPQTFLLTSPRDAVRMVVSVHDVTGRAVRELHRGPVKAGVTPFSWDGRDAAGRRVPSGVYFVRVSDGTVHVSCKSVRIR